MNGAAFIWRALHNPEVNESYILISFLLFKTGLYVFTILTKVFKVSFWIVSKNILQNVFPPSDDPSWVSVFAGDCDLVVCVSYTLEFFSLSENKSEKPRDVLSRFGALILHITLHNSSFYSTLSILRLQFIAIVKVRASELL